MLRREALLREVVDQARGTGQQVLYRAEHCRDPDLVRRAISGVGLIQPHECRVAQDIAGPF
jgi:hypothetical protein